MRLFTQEQFDRYIHSDKDVFYKSYNGDNVVYVHYDDATSEMYMHRNPSAERGSLDEFLNDEASIVNEIERSLALMKLDKSERPMRATYQDDEDLSRRVEKLRTELFISRFYCNGELTYKDLIVQLGGRPDWTQGLSDRATHTLIRAGWTCEQAKAASLEELALLPNAGGKVALEIKSLFK